MRWLVATGLVVGTVALGSCSQEPTAEEESASDAREQADAVWHAVDATREWRAGDLAREAADKSGVTLLDIEGTDTTEPDGVTLTIRVVGTGYERESDWLGGGESTELKLPFCYQLRFRNTRDVKAVTEIACPAETPAPTFSFPPRLDLPGDIEEQLQAKLPEAPAGGPVDEAAVRATVDGLDLDERVERRVESYGDAVGIALRAYPNDCLLARISPSGIEIWRPPRVQQQPGELSCTPDEALRGLGQ